MLGIFFLCFFFISCSSSHHQWLADQSLLCSPHFQSGKIYLPLQNQSSGLEIEILQGSYGQRMYLNAFSVHLPVNPESPSKIFVTITTKDETCVVEGDLFDGGQRVLLPAHAKEQIIERLLDQQTIEIKVGRYCDKIIPTGFAKKYWYLSNSL